MTYFACFGYKGLIGLFLSCALIAYCGAKALLIVREYNIEGPHTFNKIVGGAVGGRFLTVCCGLFSYSAYIVVLAGMKQICGGSIIPVAVASVCAYAVLCCGFGTLAKICSFCAPCLAGFIAVVVVIGALYGKTTTAETEYMVSPLQMTVKILLYAGYNVLTSVCVLGRCRDMLAKKSTAIRGGIIGGIMLFISGAAVLFGLVYGKIPPNIYEMPVMSLFGKGRAVIEIMVFITMFLSAITGLTGTCVFFEEYIPEKQLGVYLGLAAIPATYISFGRLMDYIYPVFGFAGIFLMIVLALMGRKKYNIEDNKLRGRGKICRIQKITKQKS